MVYIQSAGKSVLITSTGDKSTAHLGCNVVRADTSEVGGAGVDASETGGISLTLSSNILSKIATLEHTKPKFKPV